MMVQAIVVLFVMTGEATALRKTRYHGGGEIGER